MLGVVLAAGLGLVLWRTLPGRQETARIPGLSAPVSVSFDGLGVPRIVARNETDAAAALGYVHARDRMFQMELMRRAASGRLAELAGPQALPLDEMARTLGERRHAEAAWAALDPAPRAMLAAYARGVNARLAASGRFVSPEFLWLGPPEPWTPVDSLLWGETVGMWLSANWRDEIARLTLIRNDPLHLLNPARVLQLWPVPTDVPPPQASRLAPGAPAPGAAPPRFPAPFTEPAHASDEWAVDGAHSATGAPLLAGDPHLRLGFPGLWYLARIDTPTGTLAGATAPGVPFLVIGRNAHLAWTFTSAGTDVQDVYDETVLPGGGYAAPGGERAFETRVETLRVRGDRDRALTVRETRHGPVVSDLLAARGLPDRPGHVLAVAMANLQPGSGVTGLYALNHAQNVAEASQAAQAIEMPVQNLLVADAQRIAMFTTGRVPVRASGDGSLPTSGADGATDWRGFASGLALPHVIEPPSGRLVNGNEPTAPPGFPVFMGRDGEADWRARRIRALLDAGGRASLAEFAAMQADAGSTFATDLLPSLLAAPRPRGMPGEAAALLDHWDGTMRADAPQPLIFNAWVQRFVAIVLAAAHVPEEDSGPWEAFARWLLHDPDASWWCGGPCTRLLPQALTEATAQISASQGRIPSAWRWGRAHQAVFAHPLLAGLPWIGGLGERRIAVPGDDTTLFRGGSGELGDFAARHGAGYRGVYDLNDPDRSLFVVTPGQSGNVLSPHAWDLMDRWARGALIPLPRTPIRVEATLGLEP